MPVYHGDQANALDEALASLAEQSLPADEIVLVEDGPLPASLRAVVNKWQGRLDSLRPLPLPENRGLSAALNAGIEAASYEWLARMDADDICYPQRFAKQMDLIKAQPDLALLGAWIEEWDEAMQKALGQRCPPGSAGALRDYARWRCPFNHMTIFYRRSVLLALGGYRDFGAVGDDYELWGRFIMAGYPCANVEEVLVKARTGQDFFSSRRRGWRYFKSEWREILALYRMGLFGPWHLAIHALAKATVRLAPVVLVKGVYRLLRKRS